MKKKILLSVAASMLLMTTSAFAGTMTVGQAHTVLGTESYAQNGADEINMHGVTYTPNFNIQDRPSGTITDTKVELDVSEIVFPIAKVNAVLGTDYDAQGNGIAATALTIAELDALFAGTRWEDTDVSNTAYVNFHHTAIIGGKVVLVFNGAATNDPFYKGHTYTFNDTTTTANELSFKWAALTGKKLYIKTYSTTLDDSYIDSAEVGKDTALTPQFKVACVRTFDGLINFENDRVSFVNPEHAERSETALNNPAGTTNNDTVITNDRMIFTINNSRENNTTRWMGGHATQFTFHATNNDNVFELWTGSTVKVYTTDSNDVDTDITASTAPDFNYALAPGTTATAAAGTFVFDAATNIFTITFENAAFPIGKTSFVVDLLKPGSAEPLRAVVFDTPFADLEGGLALDDTRSDIVQNGHPAGPNHFVLNNEDSSDLIAPAIPSDTNITHVGEWMDHAYIAQIAGATDDATVFSKVFVVNRSCAAVTPRFKLIKDGKAVTVVAPASLGVNKQMVYKVKDIRGFAVTDMDDTEMGSTQSATSADLGDGVYAVEVILGGIAEDFYVYAQAKHKTLGQFKDLPVYNTSNRD